ncbi:ABC transporter permease [Planomonospora venezuelensis]|uniref:Putative ABC transport system permease protein n=1 Tax=Planomonospora venezuelensis TaxID=1999 RepID=A0A841DG73_PLAVE|nr:ABC transporter permease [Planomonospora venezuelensis]MBB5966216.1 putative ABC transport system permease protein [Planomonospora venezuelensis]GIM98479.1 ABC transporter permease [Planomonospora venezuelensis]
MLRLAAATLRGRGASLAGVFAALLFASVLVTACGLLVESGLRAQAPPERYAAAPVVVAGRQWTSITGRGADTVTTVSVRLTEPVTVPASLAGEIGKVPGVTRVVPELAFPVALVGRDGRLTGGPGVLGHAWESAVLTPYTLSEGRAPAAPGEIVVDALLARQAGLETGRSVRVLGRDGVREYTVSGIAGPGLARRPAVFFTAGRAGELFGRPGRVSAFGVFGPGAPAPLKARIDAALDTSEASAAAFSVSPEGRPAGGDTVAYAGADRGFAEDLRAQAGRETLVQLGSSIGGVAAMVAVFVVAGTFGLAVRQREREIALLRAVGATPRQVRSMIGREAVLLGLVAGALGVPPGVAAGHWLFGRFAALGTFPETFAPVTGPVPMLVAVVTGAATAWLAARGAVRRAARIRPAEALGEAAVERRELGRARMIAGLVFLVAGGAVSVLSMFLTGAAAAASAGGIVLLLVVAATLLGPWLVRWAVALTGSLLGRVSRVGGYLAAATTRAESRRLAAVVSPLVLMLAFASATLFTQSTVGHAAARQAEEGARADYVVTSTGPGLPPQAARAARETPGVAGVTEVIDTRVVGAHEELGDRTLSTFGAMGLSTPVHGIDLGVREGSLDRLGEDSVALSTFAADAFGVSAGERVRLLLGDGTPATPRVVAVYDRGLGFGDVVLPYDLVRGHSAAGMAGRLLVTAAPGAGDLRERLGGLAPGLTVLDRAGGSAARDAEQELGAWVNLLALGMIMVFTAVAVVNTLVMATGARVRELALLRLVGGTRRQVLSMIRWEALLVGGIAVAVGTAVAAPTLVALSYGVTGSPLPYVPPAAYAAMVAATLGLALAATLLPARAALLGRPAERIRG